MSKVSKRQQFKTGYSEPSLVRAAQRNTSKGKQIKKRDKMKHGVRYGSGQADAGHRIVTGNADRATGAFQNPNSSSSYIVPGAYARALKREVL